MMYSAAKSLFAILVGYLALAPQDQGIEMRLRQAHSQAASAPAMDGVRMAVVDAGADSETLQICRCFCQEKHLPLVAPEELAGLVAGKKQE